MKRWRSSPASPAVVHVVARTSSTPPVMAAQRPGRSLTARVPSVVRRFLHDADVLASTGRPRSDTVSEGTGRWAGESPLGEGRGDVSQGILTFLFMPESAYGPTNNCVGIGESLLRRGHRVVFAAEASWAGQARALGFGEDLVDLAPTRAARRRQRGRRASSGRTSSATPRPSSASRPSTSSRRSSADLAGADRRRQVLRAAAARDHRPPPARRDRRGQRGGVPGADDRRRRRSSGSCRATRSRSRGRTSRPRSPACRGRPVRVGRLPRGVRPHAPGAVGGVRRVVPRAGRAAACRELRVHAHVTGDANLYVYPARARLHRRAPARRHLAPDRLQRARDRRAGTSCRAELAERPEGSALDLPSLGSLGSADVDLMRRLIDVLGTTRAPVHRLARDRSADESSSPTTCGAASPAADHAAAARRPGDHPRRQQHDHRGDALRQADGACCRCSGTSTTTPSASTRLGFGVRLDTYGFSADELRTSVDDLLADSHCASGWRLLLDESRPPTAWDAPRTPSFVPRRRHIDAISYVSRQSSFAGSALIRSSHSGTIDEGGSSRFPSAEPDGTVNIC